MANKPTLAVGLDAGSSRTRVIICLLENLRLRFLGAGEARSRGWLKGRVSDGAAVAESVREATAEAERAAQVRVEDVVVGMGGASVAGFNSHGLYEFGRTRQVDTEEVVYSVRRACRVRLEDGRMVLQAFPQDFTLDGAAGCRNPRGAHCTRLEANVHVVTASVPEHQSLIGAVNQAHLAVEESVFEAVAAGYAAVLPEERARGVAIVDVGAQSTEVAIYEGDSLQLAAALPISGDHLTRDVAWGLCVSFEDAARLKEEYGCAMLGLTADNHWIEVPSSDGRPARETRRGQLNEILEARSEELFNFVYQELLRARMEKGLMEGVVLTGGGALLSGMCDMAERVLNCQARFGLPLGIRDWPEEIHRPDWTTAAGLAMYSAKLKARRHPQGAGGGWMGRLWR